MGITILEQHRCRQNAV